MSFTQNTETIANQVTQQPVVVQQEPIQISDIRSRDEPQNVPGNGNAGGNQTGNDQTGNESNGTTNQGGNGNSNNGNENNGESGNTGGTSGNGSGSGTGNGGTGSGGDVSQDECVNQYPLPPSSLPTGSAPDVDETHFGVNLEFTPVVDVVINKPKLRLANFANGSFSRKCYRQ